LGGIYPDIPTPSLRPWHGRLRPKAEDYWLGVGRPQVEVYRNCHIFELLAGMGTRRKSSRPRRDRDVGFTSRDRDVCLPRPRRDRDVDNFSRDETETRRWYTSRDRDVETETTTLVISAIAYANCVQFYFVF